MGATGRLLVILRLTVHAASRGSVGRAFLLRPGNAYARDVSHRLSQPVVASLTAIALLLAGCSSPGLLDDCQPTQSDSSVARVWDEVLLEGIRRDFPAPTVHSRNLFHVSAGMWDAWAAYDDDAAGYFLDEAHASDDLASDRGQAISFAAYRILTARYANAIGGADTLADLRATMDSLCFDSTFVETEGSSPAALGNRIAAAVLEATSGDGSFERDGYVSTDYEAVNPPMSVDQPGTEMVDPNRWQPLALDVMIAQNGIPQLFNIQEFVGAHWGSVESFALPASTGGLPMDPGPPPYLGEPVSDSAFRAAVVDVIRFSSTLDPGDESVIDISPAATGANSLGTNDGEGYSVNPVTGAEYSANVVSQADFGRVLAEFWADGPDSETPPGHWNTVANWVSDAPGVVGEIGGEPGEVDRLEWDVKLYFALNAALHDAAVAAWGAKGHYDYARPISMIRYMGGLGQSSDPAGIGFHPDGLPLVEDLIEVVTAESASEGGRHGHLVDHIGDVAIRSWIGQDPIEGDSESSVRGVDWIRAVEWVPYQRATFVTPAFAGYVSGHSAFSRAAAEVLAAFTDSPYFPGGLGEWEIPAGFLEFEAGPEEPMTLQWASYADAADQAGLSRLYGGIHVAADDLAGRVMGYDCGVGAWDLAQRYFSGSAGVG